MKEMYKIIQAAILLLFFSSNANSNDILGCGGFVLSHVQIDFSKVEVKL